MTTTRLGNTLVRSAALACVLCLLATAGLWWIFRDAGKTRVTAYFGNSIGLYAGNDVRVQGFRIGEVTDIRPQGKQVKVDFEYDRTTTFPADAHAVIITPSLVSDRYVQLIPGRDDGPRLRDGATIPIERTAVPLEVDQLYNSLNEVSSSLGPQGANQNGSLSRVLDTASRNLDGNGKSLHDTVSALSDASGTLSGSKDDLFKTVGNLGEFSETLASSDQRVRHFEGQLADVSEFLADERGNLAQTVTGLSGTLEQVRDFISRHRDRVHSNVDNLSQVSQALVDERSALAEILDLAPVGLGNARETYNGGSGTLDTRPNFNEFTQPPITQICGLLKQTPEIVNAIGDVCRPVASAANGLVPVPSVGQTVGALQQRELPPLPLPLVGSTYTTPPPGKQP